MTADTQIRQRIVVAVVDRVEIQELSRSESGKRIHGLFMAPQKIGLGEESLADRPEESVQVHERAVCML